MPDVKITGLPAASGVTVDDLFVIVNDPSGVPVTQKATAAQVLAYAQATIQIGESQVTNLTADLNDLATAIGLRLLISDFTWANLSGKPAFGALALLNTITASLINDASANGRSLITATDYAAMRGLLSLGALALLNSIATANIDNDAVTYAKMQNISATDRVLGRQTAGAGDTEEIVFTAFARSLSDDADATTARATLNAQAAVVFGRAIMGGTTMLTIPGTINSNVSTKALTASRIQYCPIAVYTAMTFDQMAIEVTNAGAGGTVARLAIYNSDSSRQPTTRIVDAGTVAVDSLGVKTASITQTLQPGIYLLAIISDGTPTLRTFRTAMPNPDIVTSIGANPYLIDFRVAGSGTNLPDPGTVWTNNNLTGSAFDHLIALRPSAV